MSAPRQCGRCGMVTCCECGWPLLLACALAERETLISALRALVDHDVAADKREGLPRCHELEIAIAAIQQTDAATTKASGK